MTWKALSILEGPFANVLKTCPCPEELAIWAIIAGNRKKKEKHRVETTFLTLSMAWHNNPPSLNCCLKEKDVDFLCSPRLPLCSSGFSVLFLQLLLQMEPKTRVAAWRNVHMAVWMGLCKRKPNKNLHLGQSLRLTLWVIRKITGANAAPLLIFSASCSGLRFKLFGVFPLSSLHSGTPDGKPPLSFH